MSLSDPDDTLPHHQSDESSSNRHDSESDLAAEDSARIDQSASDTTASTEDPDVTIDIDVSANLGDATGDFSIDPAATSDFQTSPRSTKALPRSFALQIPGYEIQGELGRGAMGVVYSARQIRADRTVALKVMLNLDHANSESIQRFQVEAQAAARLQHPNIVQVYDVGESGGCPYFTLEYVTGGTLSQKINEQMLTAEESAVLMEKIAQAMEFAHSKGIVHRDLKPTNIMLDSEGQPKIADFGLARRLEDTSHLTQEGTVVGTPSYMAPEQTLGDPSAIRPAVDIYALGAILFELLTGRPPFKGASVWEVLRQVRLVDPVRPAELQPGVPLDLETICLKCLQKEPTKRYESVLALQQDLQRFLNNEPILARPIGQWERLVRLCNRNPREAILVGSLAAVLVATTIGASIVAYRIAKDRNQIAAQSERIEKQRDEIQKEKNISDSRLTLYRETVSSLVNRAPRMLESSPMGSDTKKELTTLLNQVLSQSTDFDVVGSSKQWGIMATHLRQGETLLAEAISIGPSHQETQQAKLLEATNQLQSAVAIAEAVYQSDEPDRAKAASNYSIVLGRLAQIQFSQDKRNWSQVVPVFKRSIELAAEAVEAENIQVSVVVGAPGLDQTSVDSRLPQPATALAEYRLKQADRLFQYSQCLIQANPHDANYQNRAIQLMLDARTLNRSIADDPDLPESLIEDALNNLGLVCRLLGEIYQLRADADKTFEAYQESVASFQTLVNRSPNRPSFQRNLSIAANDFGQYLLINGSDPNRVREAYTIAKESIESLTRNNDVKLLEQLGLAIQWYALGLNAERQANKEEATRCYLMAASIRERLYREADDEVKTGITQSYAEMMRQLVSWTLCLARADRSESVLSNVKQAYSEFLEGKLDSQLSSEILSTCSSALGILAQHLPKSSSDRVALLDKAVRLLEKAIECGYDDADYLARDPDFQWLANDRLQLDRITELLKKRKSNP